MATGLSNGSGLSATGSSLILGARGLAGAGSGVSAGGGLGGGTGGLRLDFGTGVLPAGTTFTRSSNAWGFNSALVLTEYATNVPRFVYDPVTGASLGLLIESLRTNSIRNNTMVGAVVGTPGTAPTNWALSTGANGISREIVGAGVEDGIDYIDIRFSGTASPTVIFSVYFEAATTAAAAAAQVWSSSSFCRLIGGTLANVATAVAMQEMTAGGAGIGGASSSTVFVPTTAPLRGQRPSVTRTLTDATCAFVRPYVSATITSGSPSDVTLRIGLPQLEQGSTTSSPAKTTGAASNFHSPDACQVTDPRAFTDTVWIIKARTPSRFDPSVTFRLLARDNATTADTVQMQRRFTDGNMLLGVTAGGVSQASLATAVVSNNTDFAIACRIDTNNFASSLNGAAVVTDTTGALPATPTVFRVGGYTANSGYWNSTIKSIETRATATDAELQALSAPSTLYDFTLGTMPIASTFTRASTAWGFERTGVLIPYAIDQPRFVYDPVTGASLGLLVELARTNSLPNNTMIGAVIGAPGTQPTGWSLVTGGSNVAREIVGTGVEDGIEYIDIRWFGTPSATSGITMGFTATTVVAAVPAQIWSAATFIRLMAGSTTGLTALSHSIIERDAGGVSTGSAANALIPLITGAALRTQRYAATRTIGASGAFAQHAITFNFTISVPVDFTLRIGLPQLEQGYCVSSLIKTSTVAVTRARDDAFITDPRVLTDSVFIARGRTPPAAEPNFGNRIVQRDNGASADSTVISRTVGSNMNLSVTATSSQANIGGGSAAVNTDIAVATRAALNDFAISLNGGAVTTDTAGVMPATPTVFRVGGSTSVTLYWQSTIKSIETRATASDAELQSLSGVL